MNKKKQYSMLVLSHPVQGREEEYLKWYSGQHIHDLLRIPGFLGCRFYKVANAQMFGTKEEKGYPYLMVWDWETDDIEALYDEIRARKADGRSKVCDAFAGQFNIICVAATDYIRPDEVTGMSVEEVAEFSKLFENTTIELKDD